MKLKNKLLVNSMLIMATVLSFVLVGTYLFYSKEVRRLFFENLKDKAMIAAFYHLEKDELNASRFERVRQSYQQTYEASIRFFNAQDSMVFEFDSLNYQISENDIQLIRSNGVHYFAIDNRQFTGIFYHDNQGDFVITASDINWEGEHQLQKLRIFFILFFFLGLIITYFITRLLAHKTFNPFERLIRTVDNISTKNLHARIPLNTEEQNELTKLTATLNSFLDRIERGVESQRDFLKHASHELRTPLTSVIGNLDVTLAKERDIGTYQKHMYTIRKDAVNIMLILDSLLIISGLDEDLRTIPMEKIRLDELLWDVLERYTMLNETPRVSINLEDISEPDNELEIYGNKDLLIMAIKNMIDNAIKYSENRPVSIACVHKDQDRLKLSISDQGPGISPDDLRHIFDLFYRGRHLGAIDGTGIGLHLTQLICQKHGIRINVDTELGSGSTFTLTFPDHDDTLHP